MTQGDTQQHDIVGQTVGGKYKIVRLLGEGGMGAVYLGEQQLGATTRKVAVKTLHKHLSHDKSILARFEREVATVAALEHPNTIQVFDYGKMDDGTLYIVMEFVNGTSVADILVNSGAMPPARVEHIMRQVTGSLEEAHGHGIVHRDLKPDNVVLCDKAGQKDWVEVLDFGIAKRSSEHDPNEAKLTQQGMVLGTPPYMSPEQFTGQPVDLRTDIYALGVMAYEMLTGKLPWEANTAWEWASRHMTEPPSMAALEQRPLGNDVPEKMRRAISRALSKNKDERFGSVREFFDAFATGNVNPADFSMPPSLPHGAGGPPPRAKTEMAAPVASPPYGSPQQPPPAVMGGPPPAQHVAAAVPPGPRHSPPQKSGGGKGLIIGLAALAGVLLIGALIAVVATRKPKPTTTTSLDLGGDTDAAAGAASSLAHVEEPPPSVTVATPLGNTPPITPPVTPAKPPAGGGGGAVKPPSGVPTPKPADPKPPAADPPDCVKARNARKSGLPAAMVAGYENKCRAAGGTP